MAALELRFSLGGQAAEEVEAICFELGALAVTFADERDDAVLEPAPGEVRLWPATRVQALFDASAADPHLLTALATRLQRDVSSLEARHVTERVWEREWLEHWHALRFGRRLWVCPHHEQVTDPAAVVVKLDPGLAFGTGTHASTALCLEALDAEPPIGLKVIDYGCGSGVLGMAAALLGAAQTHCFDIDPQALLATRQNAADNALRRGFFVHECAGDLPAGADLLLANILADTLCALAPQFAQLLKPEGRIVLAGILSAQAPAVTAACAPWFDIRSSREREGWVLLSGLHK